MVTVGQLMKQDLVTVDAGTSVVDAAKLMKTCNVGSVLISQKGRIVGIVTESDVVKKFVDKMGDKMDYAVAMDRALVEIGLDQQHGTLSSRRLPGPESITNPSCQRERRQGHGAGLSPRSVPKGLRAKPPQVARHPPGPAQNAAAPRRP